MNAFDVCENWGCEEQGLFGCDSCEDAEPPILYCSRECQRSDWDYHKRYCGKVVYTFDLTLTGTSDPVITRTFDVPSWFTFRQLHYSIQYAMGPWRCRHMHEFVYSKVAIGERSKLSPIEVDKMKIVPQTWYKDSLSMLPQVPTEMEEYLKLSDVYEVEGRLRKIVAEGDSVLPLYYIYDFGPYWQHKLEFKGSKLARAARPLFSSATGRGPVEDCDSITGWNRIKAAFSNPNPTAQDRELMSTAKKTSRIGPGYNPSQDPDIAEMNDGVRWERCLKEFMRLSGDGEATELHERDDDFHLS